MPHRREGGPGQHGKGIALGKITFLTVNGSPIHLKKHAVRLIDPALSTTYQIGHITCNRQHAQLYDRLEQRLRLCPLTEEMKAVQNQPQILCRLYPFRHQLKSQLTEILCQRKPDDILPQTEKNLDGKGIVNYVFFPPLV